jgi:hypothetical protein
MNFPRNFTLVVLLAAAASAASAQGLSRAQVEAQLATAIRNGDMMAPGDLGLTERQLNPSRFPPQPVVAGKTRAQVQAELASAIRNGDMLVGDSGLREKDLFPAMYPADPQVAGKSRAQVRAELAMAIRDGDMLAPGDSGATEYQLNPQRYAQQRAIDQAAQFAQHDSQTGGGPN